MIIYIDIDNTIFKTIGTNYNNSTPIENNISKVNYLFDKGHTIIMWTARGTLLNKSFFNLTYTQLTKFGVKFNELRMGKPAYDLLIDDKSINSIWDWNNNSINSILKEKVDNILCIIPARSGSKGIIHKNIKLLNGLPLLAWTIKQSKKSKYIDNMRIIVSTDDAEYQKLAIKHGAEAPFLRPSEISGDLSTDYECISHCVKWLNVNDNYNPDIILHLRPTQPCRRADDIDKCIDIFIENMEKYDSLRTVIPFEKSPYKMYSIDSSNNLLKPLFNEISDIKEPYNQCRQVLPPTYLHNGYIDIIKTKILDNNTISGERIYPYIMDKNDTIDIDTTEDWVNAENTLKM
jgi:CMP-N-acetylneuraminic acid synthetase